MRHKNWVSALKLEQWADLLSSRALLPQLLRRLVHATTDSAALECVQFPSGEGIQRHGEDGQTHTSIGNAKVPPGSTAWEMGCNKDIRGKAEEDFTKKKSDFCIRRSRANCDSYSGIHTLKTQANEKDVTVQIAGGTFTAPITKPAFYRSGDDCSIHTHRKDIW